MRLLVATIIVYDGSKQHFSFVLLSTIHRNENRNQFFQNFLTDNNVDVNLYVKIYHEPGSPIPPKYIIHLQNYKMLDVSILKYQ
jgi:hypothetical protein